MAKLNPSLIFSMTRELSELHEIGQEMIEHIGSSKIVSWRFPDRGIKDVEIDLDNELFDTSEKYIRLLELIIDRLYLIINATVDIFNLMLDSSSRTILKLPKNVCKPLGLSFGTLMSFFWKRLQLLSEPKMIEFSSKSVNTTRNNSANNSQVKIIPQNCMSCETAMNFVKRLINKVEESMNNLKLESATTGNRLKIDNNILNMTQFDAMVQWTECIITDFENLTTYAHKKISEYETLSKDYNKIKQEITRMTMKLKILQNKCTDLEKSNKNLDSILQITKHTKDDLLSKYNELTISLTQSENECKTKTETISNLENNLVQSVLEKNNIDKLNAACNKEIKDLKLKNNNSEDLFNKSKTEIEELENKLKLEKEKQITTETQLLENFTKEKQKISDEKLKIEEQNKKLIKEVEQLKTKMKLQENDFKLRVQSLEDDKLKMRNEIKICKDREDVLIRCPDLNGPIICEKGKQNPVQDMENQMKANDVRVQLLQEQNTNLHRVVDKMKKLKTF